MTCMIARFSGIALLAILNACSGANTFKTQSPTAAQTPRIQATPVHSNTAANKAPPPTENAVTPPPEVEKKVTPSAQQASNPPLIQASASGISVAAGYYGLRQSFSEVTIKFDKPYKAKSQIGSCSGGCICSGDNLTFRLEPQDGSCLASAASARVYEFDGDLPSEVTVTVKGQGVHLYYPHFSWTSKDGKYAAALDCAKGRPYVYTNWDVTYSCTLTPPSASTVWSSVAP